MILINDEYQLSTTESTQEGKENSYNKTKILGFDNTEPVNLMSLQCISYIQTLFQTLLFYQTLINIDFPTTL